MTATDSMKRTALFTGLAYLGIVLCGLFAELVVRGALIVPGDAAATAARIAAEPGLFGSGIGADALMIALDVGVAFGLYRLFRPVDRRLALAATALRLVQASILAVNLVHPMHALDLAQRAAAGGAPTAEGAALRVMETHALVYDIALIPFGLVCLALGRLLRRSRIAPRLLAVGLSLTGVVYLIGSAAALLAPTMSAIIDPLYAIAIVVEPAIAIWLVIVALRRTGSFGPVPPRTRPFLTGPGPDRGYLAPDQGYFAPDQGYFAPDRG